MITVDDSKNPQGVKLKIILWTLMISTGIFVGLRLCCKYIRRRALWWDDYYIIISWVTLLVSCISTTITINHGFGLHIYEIPVQNIKTVGIIGNVSGFFSVLSVLFCKVSFASTLLRLTDGWTRRFIWIIIATLVIPGLASCAMFFATIPGRAVIIFSIVFGAWSSICDIILALLPWRILMKFHMYRREKVAVALAMSMGVFAGITGFVKCSTLENFASGDFSFDGVSLAIWGFAEVSCCIMAASIPTLRALFSPAATANRQMPTLEVNITSGDSGESGAYDDSQPASRGRKDDRSDRSILDKRINSAGASLNSAGASSLTSEQTDLQPVSSSSNYELERLEIQGGKG
ncbi:hypothetical protein B0T22DRAFT_64439 [Podospora appendiculata]|uniref:Rhodopsin domain-containing protein n=1 Tax=Podospora appendiculata TaxID=314037 RepID=A0AAE0XIU6_9PEZI|nr:hypothetical protein B0T22DRAFT_64439 [Podospora appendiculata]